MRQLLVIIILFFTISCQREKHSESKVQPKVTIASSPASQFQEQFDNRDLIKELTERVTVHGDTAAFNRLEYIYVLSGHENEFFFYSYIMAAKFGNAKAYYINYSILKTEIKSDDFKERNAFADYYLLKAYEKGYDEAIFEVKTRFQLNKLPKADEYWDMINKYN